MLKNGYRTKTVWIFPSTTAQSAIQDCNFKLLYCAVLLKKKKKKLPTLHGCALMRKGWQAVRVERGTVLLNSEIPEYIIAL